MSKKVDLEWSATSEVLRVLFDDISRAYAEDGEKFCDFEEIESLRADKKRNLRRAVALAESRDLDEETYLALFPLLEALPRRWPANSGNFVKRFWYVARSRKKAVPVQTVQTVTEVAREILGEKVV